MKYIGFTNKFYTLWDVYEDSKPLGNGRTIKVTKHIYIKNISFDRDKAFAAYPDAEFDENLRGHSSFDSNERIEWDNVDTFRFGKYMFMKIEEVNDLNYTAWYWDQAYGEHKDFVSEFLKKNGYEIRTHTWKTYEGFDRTDEYLMSPEALAIEKAEAEKLSSDEKLLETGEPLSFLCEYNLDENGEVCDGNLTYKFSETKEMEYRGWPYWLPIKNGKAKRIKNKNITITKYTFKKNNYGFTVNVIDFEISK